MVAGQTSFSKAIAALNTVALLRAAALGGSLVAMSLTFRVLDADAFTLFNFVTFLIAMAAAFALPLNRAFWAAKSKEAFVPALFGGAIIVTLTLTIGLLTTQNVSTGLLLILAAAVAYAVVRTVERYGYSLLLVERRNLAAGGFLALFAAVEIAVVGAMWLGGKDDLSVRFGASAILFALLAALTFAMRWMPAIDLAAGVGRLAGYVRTHLFSAHGASFIFVAILMTLANMVERALMTLLPLADAGFGAAYLLALSYTVALATFLSFLFDLARVNVFREGQWQDHGPKTLLLYAGVATAIILAALVTYPLLVWIGLISPQIGWFLWGAFLLRSLATMLVNLFNVDHYQEGRTGNIVLADGILILFVLAAFTALRNNADQQLAALIISSGSIAVITASGWRVRCRVGAAR